MPGSEQHARHAHDLLRATFFQLFKAFMNDRQGEFQKPAFHIEIGKLFAEMSGERVEFVYGGLITAAMAANHNGGFVCHLPGPCLRALVRLVLASDRLCNEAHYNLFWVQENT